MLFLLLSLLVERSASKLQVLFADEKGILDTVTRGEFVFFSFFLVTLYFLSMYIFSFFEFACVWIGSGYQEEVESLLNDLKTI